MANWFHRRLFGNSPQPVAGATAQIVAELEARLKKLTESTQIADRWIQPYERFLDGDKFLFPSGYPTDRKGGKNWPVIQTEIDLRQARAFCRLIGDTNPLVIAFLDHVTNFVVGPGFKWDVTLRGKAAKDSVGDPDAQACQRVLDEFRALNGWGDVQEITLGDYARGDDSPLADLEGEMWRSAMRDGEVFLRLFKGGADTNGIPRARRINPECVGCPPGGDQQGDWSWGILTEPGDRQTRLQYHVLNPDKPETVGDIIDAVRVLHLKLNVDSDVKRGLPDFWPLQDEVQTIRSLWRNMAEAAAICSAIAYIRQHAPNVTSTQIANMIPKVQSGYDYTKFVDSSPGQNRLGTFDRHESGTILDITAGMQYVAPPIVAGAPGFVQIEQALLRICGVRWGCPEYFSGDSSNANYASTLVSGGPFERAAKQRQRLFKLFQGNLAHRVLLLAVESGRLSRDQLARIAFTITPPAVAIANQNEDTQRRATLYDKAGLSKRTWLSEEGYDPDDEFKQRQAEDAAQAKAQPGAGGLGGDGQPIPPEPKPSGDNPTGMADLFESIRKINDTVTKIVEDRAGLVFDQTKHRWVNPNKDDATTGTNPKANEQPVPFDEHATQAKIAKMPGLGESDRKGLFEAAKGIYAAGSTAVKIAKVVVQAVLDEAKLWTTKLALHGITFADALPDTQESTNPLSGSTAATGGQDLAADATGIPSAQYLLLKIAPKIARSKSVV